MPPNIYQQLLAQLRSDFAFPPPSEALFTQLDSLRVASRLSLVLAGIALTVWVWRGRLWIVKTQMAGGSWVFELNLEACWPAFSYCHSLFLRLYIRRIDRIFDDLSDAALLWRSLIWFPLWLAGWVFTWKLCRQALLPYDDQAALHSGQVDEKTTPSTSQLRRAVDATFLIVPVIAIRWLVILSVSAQQSYSVLFHQVFILDDNLDEASETLVHQRVFVPIAPFDVRRAQLQYEEAEVLRDLQNIQWMWHGMVLTIALCTVASLSLIVNLRRQLRTLDADFLRFSREHVQKRSSLRRNLASLLAALSLVLLVPVCAVADACVTHEPPTLFSGALFAERKQLISLYAYVSFSLVVNLGLCGRAVFDKTDAGEAEEDRQYLLLPTGDPDAEDV
ncbi:hypothetical protein JCM1840_000453 [Sporobolomyces johnsonii]